MKIQTILIFIAALILCVVVVEYAQDFKLIKDSTYNEELYTAYVAGYNDTTNQLIYLAFDCKTIPITYQNQTVNLIAVECLNQTKLQEVK
jgi:hypothetical protein